MIALRPSTVAIQFMATTQAAWRQKVETAGIGNRAPIMNALRLALEQQAEPRRATEQKYQRQGKVETEEEMSPANDMHGNR